MTERKPPGMSFETWIDRQIREAEERGAFDNLPGAGKPLPNRDKPFSMDQWVADWARREGMGTEAMLPEPLRLRKEIDRLPATVADLRSAESVREVVDDLNRRIKDWIRYPTGPRVVVVPVDADAVVSEWRQARQKAVPATAADGPPTGGPSPPRVSWWRRIVHRRR
jgi:hypothetical protein